MARVLRKRSRSRRRSVKSRPKTMRRLGRVVGRRIMNPTPTRYLQLLKPFPKFKFTRHKYVDTVILPPKTGSNVGFSNWYLFSANSLYDPDRTAIGGHYPAYRNNMAAVYQSYLVVDSYIKVTCDPTMSQKKFYGIVLDDDESGLQNDPIVIKEQFGGTGPHVNSQRTKNLILRKSYNAAKEFGTTVKGLMADDDKKTAAGANPATKNARTFCVWHAPQIATELLQAETVTVEITYVAVWMDPIEKTSDT